MIYLCFLTFFHVKDQLARVSLLSGILFITLGLGSDGAPPMLQSRTPPSSLTGLPDLPMSLSGYSYMLLKLGPLQFTRKGLSVGSTAACLTFIVSLRFAASDGFPLDHLMRNVLALVTDLPKC